jgi:hypothetical protein
MARADPGFSPIPSMEGFGFSRTSPVGGPEYSPTPSIEQSKNPGPDFVEWLQSGDGVYWIQGKMGCGKSTLMKYVAGHALTREYLMEWADGQTLHYPSYYFSKAGTSELQKSLQGLYRTLLATLIQNEERLFRVAFPAWQISDFDHEPTSAVLREALDNVLTLSDFSCKYCFFIDGLDEYQETDDDLRRALAKGIFDIAHPRAVKLVVSSNPEAVFKLQFGNSPTMKLHDRTRRDIIAYVDAEIRRRALPQDLTSVENDQLSSLCDEVISKAEGVFLWVTIAVASILNGIADYETFPQLEFRLRQLDPKLRVLFKQVLTDKVQASHRKEVAKSLLAESRAKQYLFPHTSSEFAICQAIIPRFVASKDHRLLINDCNIDTHVLDLQKCLPGRSCGLYAEPEAKMGPTAFRPRPLRLLHSSLYEFLHESETQRLLSKQAGSDFQVDEAVAVGRMAELVCRMRNPRNLEPEFITNSLTIIIQDIEIAEISTGLAQTKLLSIFDELLGRDFKSGNRMLADSFKTGWDPLYEDHLEVVYKRRHSRPAFPLLRTRGYSDHGSDPLSLTIGLGYSCYLKYKISTCRGLPHKAGTPLLFYPLWARASFLAWVNTTGTYKFHFLRQRDQDISVTLVELLLAEGADPNQRCLGLTPWWIVLHRICSRSNDENLLLRVGRKVAVTYKTLEVAKLMIQHGADPSFCVETPDFTISPQIFAVLLDKECCSGSALNHCFCDYAMQVKPRLTELVCLVKEPGRQKRQMMTEGELLVQGAWLAVVLVYILQRFLTSSF